MLENNRRSIVSARRRGISPYPVLAGGIFAASTASIFIRFAQAEGASSLVIAGARLTLASLVLTPLTWRNHRASLRALSRQDLALAVLSGVFLALHFATWISSLEHVPVLVSVTLVSTSPLWVALFAPFLLRELLTRRTLVGIVVAFLGGLLISAVGNSGAPRSDGVPLLGSFLAVLGAIAVALYLIIGRRLRRSLDLLPYIWLVYGSAAATMLLTIGLAGLPLTGYTAAAYGWMVMLAVIPQLIGHTALNYALGHVSAAYVSLVTLAEPVGSAILAAILLGEVPGPLQIAGAALILFAVAFAQQAEASARPEPVAPTNA